MTRSRRIAGGALALCLTLGLGLVGATRGGPAVPDGAEAMAEVRIASVAPAQSSAAQSSAASDPLEGWTLRQKVGQLFMVGVPVTGDRTASTRAVERSHVGNIFLAGRSNASVGTVRSLVKKYTRTVSEKTTRATPMFVATDQEGGKVQVLRGPGFSSMPTALKQSTWSAAKLTRRSTTWGRQLARAGVNLNLAPVMDVVTNSHTARTNGPVGVFHRNYGYGPVSTAQKAAAFAAGMSNAGVDVAIKHFPGLGRVGGNTDTAAKVVDHVTTARASDPQIRSFQRGIDAGAAFVMVSSAYYPKIDSKRPAAFSRRIVTTVLRQQLGFTGVVISDDLSAAKAVGRWKPGTRAVKFIQAGGDLILVSARPSDTKAMVDAVVAKARTSPAFAAQVDAAARRVLAAKQSLR